MTTKIALITGITGQDGSYLAELLLEKGYEVHGIIRRSSSFNTGRIDHLYNDPHILGTRLFLHFGDISDGQVCQKILAKVAPDEVYHLAAQSHVRVSFDIPEYTADITGVGTMRILEAIKNLQQTTGKLVRFYQASSSEMFGSAPPPQNERTAFHPRSPYACAKVFAYHSTVNYREAYNIFAANGILFNHESPRRGETFVTKKITRGVARIAAGLDSKIYLGNLDAARDWGYAKEYMEAAWLMLQHSAPDDFVVGTGEMHTVREFLTHSFAQIGIEDWSDYVVQDERYHRPTEVDALCADASKAKKMLGWSPTTSFPDLVALMMRADLDLVGIKSND